MRHILTILLLVNLLYADWRSERESLENVSINEPFRIFYSLSNKHKVLDQKAIKNIEDQLTLGYELLIKKRNLQEPLKNKNYHNKAYFIDVHILNLKHNGLAGDAIIKYNYKAIENSSYSISMSLSNKLSKTNLTPLHELVHIYQNAYTKIKNRWVTEGIARLLEELIRDRKISSIKLPSNKAELKHVVSKTYDNAKFFKRFEELCKKDIFIKSFFEELSAQDNIIAKKYHYDKEDWKEKEQKSSKNNPFIFQALQNTIKRTCPDNNNEINTFYTLLKN